MRVREWCGVVLLWSLFASFAAAQGETRDIALELGFSNEMVAGAWNPLRLTTRGVGGAELVIEIDEGGLREGAKIVRYRAPLPAGGGMAVLEDDLYLPPRWRALSWAVRSGDVTLASGAFDPRAALDPRPLQLVAADGAGRWRTLFDLLADPPSESSGEGSGEGEDGGGARVIEVTGSLPERAAAYDGVETLLLDGSAPPPRPQALAAAAAGGVRVLLAEPLPPSFESLSALASPPVQRLGSGWLVRAAEADLGAVLTSLDAVDAPALAPALTEALLTPDLLGPPPVVPSQPLLLGLAGYLVVALLLVRFGGVPGLLTALALAPVASLAAWGYARPPSATPVRSRSLSISAGGLAYGAEVRSFFLFAGGAVTGPPGSRLLGADALEGAPGVAEAVGNTFRNSLHTSPDAATRATAVERTPEALLLELPRWSSATFMLAPRLEPARLSVRGSALVNAGADALVDVYVVGEGVQEDLAPDSVRQVRAGEEDTRELPLVYRGLLPRLPEGSAVARLGGHIFVALPQPSRFPTYESQTSEPQPSTQTLEARAGNIP